MQALIVDCGVARGSLGAVRGLARGGWTVGVATRSRVALPALSRFAARRHIVPAPEDGGEDYVTAVAQIAARHRYDLVLAGGDAELLILSRERDRVPALLPYPPHATLLQALDKRELARAAQATGIASPPLARSVVDAVERWGRGPLVVKESLHGPRTRDEPFHHFAAERFEQPQDAERRVRAIRAAGSIPVIQPAIVGRLMAFASVVDESGAMLARVQQIAERTYPLQAGLSVRAVTVSIDDALASRVQRLLAQLGWVGLSELQFIVPSAGPPVLLDFNGRIYGSLGLALASGVNLPDIWARSAMRLPLNPPVDAVPGVRYHWLEGDLKAARERPDHRLGDVIECLRYARRSHGSIWSMRDPVPALRAGARVSAGTMRAIIHSRVRRRSASIRNDALPLDGRDDHPPRPATEAAEF